MGDLIREGNGKIVITSPSGREIFNTNTPMPARLGVLNKTITVSFPKAPGENVTLELRGNPLAGTEYLVFRRILPAHELIYQYSLGLVPDGVDFLLPAIQFNSISRTYGQWNHPRSPFTAGGAWYIANGSVLLESLPHGSMHRAMHIFVSGNEVICQLQQTNTYYDSGFAKATQVEAQSTYNLSFKIEYGKFIDGAV